VQEGKQPGQSNGSELSIEVNRGAGKTSTESEAMGANSMSKGGENAEAKNPNSNSNKTIIYGIRRNEARRGINENKFEGSSGKTLRNGRIPELEPPALALPRAGKHTAAEEARSPRAARTKKPDRIAGRPPGNPRIL